MKRYLTLLLVTVALCAWSVSAAQAKTSSVIKLSATLKGMNEVPMGDMHGTGTASIRLYPAKGEVCWTIQVSGIALPATLAHVHAGKAGVSGPVQVPLTPPSKSGKSTGCKMGVNATLIKNISNHASSYYVNVHNAKYPAGAVRGQLH